MASALGHQVKVAYDGKTALQFTSVEPFDVVFLDIECPTWLRREAAFARGRRLALSAPRHTAHYAELITL
jgi:CheY-like chemotaxis protein